ncbi:hydrophobin [Pluteus cervinus]|uniref:Hydrophobin n=1 Tax=Pluteus cervinus TaxID=181527 RepID=A0ACD3ARW6_9AGAR|nr:hydrophobin [Pluteus cervinus]
MISHLQVSTLLSLVVFSTVGVAVPATSHTDVVNRQFLMPASQCSTGSIRCCQTVVPASDSTASWLLNLMGVVPSDPTTLVGISCSWIDFVGVETCSAQPVCCQDNLNSLIVAMGCTPVDLGL